MTNVIPLFRKPPKHEGPFPLSGNWRSRWFQGTGKMPAKTSPPKHRIG